jgi:hypothetical protein
MSRRYSCKACACGTAEVEHTHGLDSTPDEWALNLRGPTHAATILYISGAPDATSIVTAADATGTCDVFAYVNHSIVK